MTLHAEPTIRVTPLLDFLALLAHLGAEIDRPDHHAGRLQALNEVRIYVKAVIEPAERAA